MIREIKRRNEVHSVRFYLGLLSVFDVFQTAYITIATFNERLPTLCTNSSLGPIVIVLLVSVITVIRCRKFNIPSMLGYLLVGFIAGRPGMFKLIPQSHATDYLGEIGIVFLMFSIGSEFSCPSSKSCAASYSAWAVCKSSLPCSRLWAF